MTTTHLVATLAAVVVLTGACGGDDAGDVGTDAGDDAMGASVSLTAAEFAFDPSELSVAAGGTIEFTNADDVKHNFTAEDAAIDDDVDAGGSTTIDLGAVDAGSYDFFCEYHPDAMTGTLDVTE